MAIDSALSTRRLCGALLALTMLVAAVETLRWLDPGRDGLNANYYADTAWTPTSVIATRQQRPSTKALIDTWRGAPPETFSVAWSGAIGALHDGAYTLATFSDAQSTVFVDGEQVVENGGGFNYATGTIHLAAGTHAILIQYV